MIIKISFFREAEDELDAEAMEPDRVFHCSDIAEAEGSLGLLERMIDRDEDEHDKLLDMEVDTI